MLLCLIGDAHIRIVGIELLPSDTQMVKVPGIFVAQDTLVSLSDDLSRRGMAEPDLEDGVLVQLASKVVEHLFPVVEFQQVALTSKRFMVGMLW